MWLFSRFLSSPAPFCPLHPGRTETASPQRFSATDTQASVFRPSDRNPTCFDRYILGREDPLALTPFRTGLNSSRPERNPFHSYPYHFFFQFFFLSSEFSNFSLFIIELNESLTDGRFYLLFSQCFSIYRTRTDNVQTMYRQHNNSKQNSARRGPY